MPPPIEIVAALVLVLLVLILAVQAWGARGLGHRLETAGWAVYLKPGCPACTLQKQVPALKENPFSPRRYVCHGGESATSPARCAEFDAFPAWHNERTGEVRYGLQTARALHKMADF